MEPGTYRPTTLKLASSRCPRAIDHYRADRPTNRRIFGVGIAVHAIIQAVTEAANQLGQSLDEGEFDAVSLAVCERMIREGRSFEGRPEPPLPADDVWEGRALARAFVERHPVEPAELMGAAEVGMAVDMDWQPVEYSAQARLRLIADYVTVVEEFDEESAARVLVVRDYKSAWPTGREELDTVQLRAQAVLAWIFHGGEEVDCLRQEVTNLRTMATYSRELWMLEGGMQTLDRWREEIEATMRALDAGRGADGLYAASPGGGCIGCPFLAHCEPGKAWADQALEHRTAEERALAYVATYSRLKQIEEILRTELEDGPVEVPGGVVGTVGKEGRAPVSDAWQVILDEWISRNGEPAGLLKTLGIGVCQIDKVAKALFPERSDAASRKEWVGELTEPVVRRKFGFHKEPKK